MKTNYTTSEKKKQANRKNGVKGSIATRVKWKTIYYSSPKICPQCNSQLPWEKRNNRFCNSSCAGTFNNLQENPNRRRGPPKKVREKPPAYSKLYSSTCGKCSAPILARTRQKYCSSCRECYSHRGRARFWFTFRFEDYSDIFDLESIRNRGMYHPTKNKNGFVRDHQVSVAEAITKDYNPYYIKHPLNCKFILQSENLKKQSRSSISYEHLCSLVDEYESTN